ncbi:hypothetical protein MTO96_000670 [Rhipicephalus appendiculatus]
MCRHRNDSLFTKPLLCEKHFAPTDFVRTATYTDAQTGKVIEVPLERVRLKETAVPSVFANCPKYMSRPTPSAREAPEEKKVRLEAASLRAAIELSVAAQEEENRKNKVGSFEEFCRALSNFSVSDFWSVIIKESKVVFLDLALQRAPAVRSSVAVSVDLCIDVFIGEARIENLPSVNVPSHLQDLRQLNEVLQSVEQLHVSHSSDDNQKAHRLLKIVLMLLEDVCISRRVPEYSQGRSIAVAQRTFQRDFPCDCQQHLPGYNPASGALQFISSELALRKKGFRTCRSKIDIDRDDSDTSGPFKTVSHACHRQWAWKHRQSHVLIHASLRFAG